MFFAIVAMLSALFFYSLAIGVEQFKKELHAWIVWVFGLGLLCDLTGTIIMGFQTSVFKLNSHTICGIFALSVMIIHFCWAIKALNSNEKAKKLFTKFSPFAWGIWLTAFITGIP